MINLRTGKPGSAMSYTEDEARTLALSLKIKCQFGKPDCTSRASCGCPYVCTPPAENSNPLGVPLGGADGQGACILTTRADYVLIFPGVLGPELREFQTASHLVAFLSGFQPLEVVFSDSGRVARAAI